MTLHLKSRGYPFRPRLLFSSFIVVGVGFPTVYYFRRGHSFDSSEVLFLAHVENYLFPRGDLGFSTWGSGWRLAVSRWLETLVALVLLVTLEEPSLISNL